MTNIDPLKHLDFPTHVACMGAVSNAAGERGQCANEATRIVMLSHRPDKGPEGKCGTSRYPVCDGHATEFRVHTYRMFHESDTPWGCNLCDTKITDPDQIIELSPLWGTTKETP